MIVGILSLYSMKVKTQENHENILPLPASNSSIAIAGL